MIEFSIKSKTCHHLAKTQDQDDQGLHEGVGIHPNTQHCLWKLQNPWLSNRRSCANSLYYLLQRIILQPKWFQREILKLLQLNRGGSENNFLLVGYPGSTIQEEASSSKPYQKECKVFLTVHRGERVDRSPMGPWVQKNQAFQKICRDAPLGP